MDVSAKAIFHPQISRISKVGIRVIGEIGGPNLKPNG
jgi:hypothetical protein